MKKLLIVLAMLLVSKAYAVTDQLTVGAGLNYSSIQLRYITSPIFEWQLRNDSNVLSIGASLSKAFYTYKTVTFRAGGSTYVVNPSGNLTVAFLNAEWMITKRIGLCPEFDLFYDMTNVTNSIGINLYYYFDVNIR